MKCSECQAENPDTQKFCGECGAQINRACPGCGHNNPPQYKFCGECGHDLTPSSHITIDQNGLILDVNNSCARLLSMEEGDLIGKPVTLFIHANDMVIFFKHRNNIFSTQKKESFEMRLLKKEGVQIHARIEGGLIYNGNQDVHLMRMAIFDISEKRQALDELQCKKDLQNIIFSMSGELTRCPTRDIDLHIIRTLKTIGVFSEVDRSYIYQFHDNQSKISITHEWCSEGIKAQDKRLKVFSEMEIPDIFAGVKRFERIVVSDIKELPIQKMPGAKKFHINGVNSFICIPMILGKELLGLIGCDSLRKRNAWPRDVIALLQVAGEIFLNSIQRQRAGESDAGLEIGEEAIRLTGNVGREDAPREDASQTEGMREIYDGPIELHEIPLELIREEPAPDSRDEAESTGEWTYRKGAPEDPSKIQKVFKKIDKVRVACPRCGRKKDISISEIDALGNTLRITCRCKYEFHIMLELRNFFRKKVDFEGFFIRLEPGKEITDSDKNWGGATIKNLSKTGIGFIAARKHLIRPGDEFRVRFTLDNSARTLIHRDVIVKSVNGDDIGCQFIGEDKQDITLGFYLL